MTTASIARTEVLSRPAGRFEARGNPARGAGKTTEMRAGTAGPGIDLKAAVRRRGLTMKELATKLGVSAGYLSGLSTGRNQWTQQMRAKAMAVLGEVPGQGIVYRQGGELVSASAERVVLSAGVYHSPQILTLSGVGREEELRRLGIPSVLLREGVGENYQDHATLTMTYEGRSDFDPDWVIPRFRLMYKSDASLPCGNFHIFQRPPTIVQGVKRMMPVSANLVEQRARGSIRFNSTDPDDIPQVFDAMLKHPEDLRAMLTAMEFIHELVSDESMEAYYGPLLSPADGEDWAEFALGAHASYHHGVGTCKMGPESDPMAVVGSDLRVHGVDNLYVADASIMPTIPHANTNVTSIMIGERLSDIIKAQD